MLCSYNRILLCQIKLKKRIRLSSSLPPPYHHYCCSKMQSRISSRRRIRRKKSGSNSFLYPPQPIRELGLPLSEKECFQLIFENESHIKRGRNTEYDKWQFNWVWVLSILVVCLCTPWFREEWLQNRIWPQDNHCWTTPSRSTKAGQLLSSVQIIQFQLLINLNGRG